MLLPPAAVKALSLWQPHAGAVVLDLKLVETRGRRISYRGRIAIAATLVPQAEAWAAASAAPDFDEMLARAERQWPDDPFPAGAIVGTVEVVGDLPTEACIREPTADGWEWWGAGAVIVSDEMRAWGDFSAGRRAWLLRAPRPLPVPIPCRGLPGLWNWSPPEGTFDP